MQTEKIIIDLEGYAAMNFRGFLAQDANHSLQNELDKGNIPPELLERATSVLTLFKQIGFDSSFLGGSTF